MIGHSRSLPGLLGQLRVILGMRHHLDKARQKCGIALAPRAPAHLIPLSVVLTFAVQHEQNMDISRSPYNTLSPFMDHEGTVRVGGRLARADLSRDQKYPVILPKSSALVQLIISHYHNMVRHQGRTITLAAVRNAGIFVPGLRSAISSFISKCSFCARLRRQPVTPKMADLPSCRIEQTPPFTCVGLDAFGPFMVTDGRHTRRCLGARKVWVILFMCMYSRSVHMEVVPCMDTAFFIKRAQLFFCSAMCVQSNPLRLWC